MPRRKPSLLCDKSPHRRRHGFSLMELSVVIVIIAVITGASVMMGNSMIESTRRASTSNKLDAIETALQSYRTAYNRLPCPADATLAKGSANYGVEAANAGTCTGGTPAANYSATITALGNAVVEGAVPVKALSLPDEFMLDGWGRKITYAVWAPITGADAFFTYGISGNCGAVTVKDAGGTDRTTAATYLLLSHGANGHGGFLPGGTRMNANSVNADEQANCHCNATATATTYAATYVQKEATQNPGNSLDGFDDVVRFKERFQLKTSDDWYSPASAACGTTSTCRRIDGIVVDHKLGELLTTGDVNGDGHSDLFIVNEGSATVDTNVFVVFGTASGIPDTDLATLDGTNGFTLTVPSGEPLKSATGDINGDGIDDIIVARPNINEGTVFVLFGKTTGWVATYSLVTAGPPLFDGTSGVVFFGVSSGDRVGEAVAAGDVNGDGKDDVIMGAYNANGTRGYTYVVFGKATPWPTWYHQLTASGGSPFIDGTTGFRLDGVSAGDVAGQSIAAGDVNGDGKDDILIGANGANSLGGYVYVVFGKASGWSATKALSPGGGSPLIDGTQGIRLDGVTTGGDQLGQEVHASDVNGDGKDDIIAGASSANGGRGYAYVIFGKAGVWTATNVLNTGGGNLINGTSGFRLDGTASDLYIGGWFGSGDVNGDGGDDIILGTNGANGETGYSYVVFGKAAGWSATQTLATGSGNLIDGANGFRLDGVSAGDQSGSSVLGDDFDGDGLAEVVIGARKTDPNSLSNAGSVYVVPGAASGWSATQTLCTP